MKRVYIGIDGETDTILTVNFSKASVLEELFQIVVYIFTQVKQTKNILFTTNNSNTHLNQIRRKKK